MILLLTLALQVTTVTDKSWKGKAGDVDGFEKADFDDSAWAATDEDVQTPVSHGEHYAVLNMFGFASKARWITVGDDDRCSLRRIIEVPKGFRRAEMVMVVDDDADVFVNGEKISVWKNTSACWGMRGGAGLVDLVPWLAEGRNVVAVRLTNNGGPWGFAAEIRIDGEPMVLPVRTAKEKLPDGVAEQFAKDARNLVADEIDAREEAGARLMAAVEKHGMALLEKVKELVASKDPEVRAWGERAMAKLAPELGFPNGKDERFGFGELDVKTLKATLTAKGERQVVLVRYLTSARVLAMKGEEDFADALRHVLDGAGDEVWSRVVPYVSFLEMKSMADELASAVKERPKTPAGACAASALGRMGDVSKAGVLEAAAKCGYGPTERAARHALRMLGK